jgi:hypothetical protein
LDSSIQAVARARKHVSKGAQKVRGESDKALLAATAYAWFRTDRAAVESERSGLDLTEVNRAYQWILDALHRDTAKKALLDALRETSELLITLRGTVLNTAPAVPSETDDEAPDFTPLVADKVMRDILVRRWRECVKCLRAEANLAGIVMMGGLLEALFVARALRLGDKRVLTAAKFAPKDDAGKAVDITKWMLDSYIKVSHELGWISDTAKDVADVLKEYRNYVHPEKERRHGVVLAEKDSVLLWGVTKSLVRQLLSSAS